ncbi:signal peptidase II [Candidatus Peregrinibacteria bacterium]|nr:MAG: signal peptidase II [Candidatus Peregrinibacteria bacterium]
MNFLILPIGITASILFLDLISKYEVQQYFQGNTVEIIPGLFAFEYHRNTGIALSLPVPLVFQVFLTIFLLLGLLCYGKEKAKTQWEQCAIASIIGGALGNFWERVAFGSVTDFIAVWKFPVFNVADIAISLGIAALILYELSKKKSE